MPFLEALVRPRLKDIPAPVLARQTQACTPGVTIPIPGTTSTERRLASSKVNPPVTTTMPAQPTNEAALIPLPVSPDPDTVSSRSVEPTPSPAASVPLADITDLLADSAPPALDAAAPIEPSTSPLSSSQHIASPPALSENVSEPAITPDEEVETQEEEAEPDTTTGLNGGTTGVDGVDNESTLVEKEDDMAEPEAEPGDEERSETASTNGEFVKKHEKKNSSVSSGSKKIDNLGGAGKRRKDSSTSAKDITV